MQSFHRKGFINFKVLQIEKSVIFFIAAFFEKNKEKKICSFEFENGIM